MTNLDLYVLRKSGTTHYWRPEFDVISKGVAVRMTKNEAQEKANTLLPARYIVEEV